MFINFSNHNSALWSKNQLDEAHKYGEIIDISFPATDPLCNEKQILETAMEYAEKISAMNPDAILAQGEMSLCYAVVSMLKKKGLTVLCATSERITETLVSPEGETVKTSTFRFVGFREYVGF